MPTYSKPVIGITSSLNQHSSDVPFLQLGYAYTTAVQKAGGIPVIIPVGTQSVNLDALLSTLDGVLFSGGGDIDPALFGGTPHPRVYGILPERDQLEIELVKKVLEIDKPFLGICRGAQVLNVALGGKLYTDIQDQLLNAGKHDWFPGYERDRLSHTVKLTNESKLHQIFNKDEIHVNSLHHQGISQLGNGLMVSATAPDGLVEAIEVNNARFALGVQWHPECLPNDQSSQELFLAFIQSSLK